ncbi:hypothetical protein AVEN_164534-1 [Araneus ventricosus]|uniref:Uncharacterized protein n=1 Tax=Araneus ventricosus TaxID=182803 RepID=A0A4Y2B1X9_ARAVE|nr:hypothetical protein AVEN_164534-1 [Araneus ventricosus]
MDCRSQYATRHPPRAPTGFTTGQHLGKKFLWTAHYKQNNHSESSNPHTPNLETHQVFGISCKSILAFSLVETRLPRLLAWDFKLNSYRLFLFPILILPAFNGTIIGAIPNDRQNSEYSNGAQRHQWIAVLPAFLWRQMEIRFGDGEENGQCR